MRGSKGKKLFSKEEFVTSNPVLAVRGGCVREGRRDPPDHSTSRTVKFFKAKPHKILDYIPFKPPHHEKRKVHVIAFAGGSVCRDSIRGRDIGILRIHRLCVATEEN